MSDYESEWQAAVIRHLNRPNSPFRFWRQNAGQWEALRRNRKGTDWIHGAPEGACDLVGFHRGSGIHCEVENKRWKDRTKKSRREKQQAWRDMINGGNGVATQAKPDPSRTLEENLEQLERELLELVAKRIKSLVWGHGK